MGTWGTLRDLPGPLRLPSRGRDWTARAEDREAPPRPGPRLARRSRSHLLFVLFLPLLRGPGSQFPSPKPSAVPACGLGRLQTRALARALGASQSGSGALPTAASRVSGKNWRTWPVLTSPVTPGASSRPHSGLPVLSGPGVDSTSGWKGCQRICARGSKLPRVLTETGNYKNVTEIYSVSCGLCSHCIVACLPGFLQRERKHFVSKRVLLVVPEKASWDTRQQRFAKRAASMLPRTCPAPSPGWAPGSQVSPPGQRPSSSFGPQPAELAAWN